MGTGNGKGEWEQGMVKGNGKREWQKGNGNGMVIGNTNDGNRYV